MADLADPEWQKLLDNARAAAQASQAMKKAQVEAEEKAEASRVAEPWVSKERRNLFQALRKGKRKRRIARRKALANAMTSWARDAAKEAAVARRDYENKKNIATVCCPALERWQRCLAERYPVFRSKSPASAQLLDTLLDLSGRQSAVAIKE